MRLHTFALLCLSALTLPLVAKDAPLRTPEERFANLGKAEGGG